jgi:mannan endo-1,4-beta-mannosidase
MFLPPPKIERLPTTARSEKTTRSHPEFAKDVFRAEQLCDHFHPRLSTLFITALLVLVSCAQAQTVKLVSNEARLSGPRLVQTRAGYSGTGYITDLSRDADTATWDFEAEAGIYDLYIRYASGGDKGFSLSVDGFGVSGMLPQSGDRWTEIPAGKVELVAGKNSLILKKGWGYYDLDSIEFKRSAPVQPLKPISPIPVTPNASPEAVRLLRFLCAQYGKRTLTGQTDLAEAETINRKIGVYPAIVATDFMDYSPSRLPFEGAPNHGTEDAIEAAREHRIIAIQWHWNAPTHLLNTTLKDAQGRDIDAHWYKGFYTNASTFDVAQAMSEPQSEEHKLIDRDIDAIAVELKKYQAAHVPVLFRPLHEAEGGWFWWGAKGPKPCVLLYRYLYHRLVDIHHINNLIWVWNSPNPAWYPGDDEVDVMSVDAYPEDPRDTLFSTWQSLRDRFDGSKMIALAEIGGVPDVERNFRFGVLWAYYVSWGGSSAGGRLPADELRRRYLNSRTVVSGSWK